MPKDTMPKLDVVRKTGSERFRSDGLGTDFDLLDFWQWSMSDLVNNTTRGVLAEYIVACAVGVSTAKVRDAWAAFDLETPKGIKIEVKSSSYLQRWAQSCFSTIRFGISPTTRAWDHESGTYSGESKRQADIYVFALLAHRTKSTINPINLDQWKFYVLTAAELDTHLESKKKTKRDTLSLSELTKLASPVDFQGLATAVSQRYASTDTGIVS